MAKKKSSDSKMKLPKVSIWGSCVSRDTCEFLPEAIVEPYVARQSAIVTLAPYSGPEIPVDRLGTDFQRRMLAGDAAADVAERITSANPDLVLIDLVDERRGVWKFPDGSYLTNSIEAFGSGVEKWGPEGGARLIEFGTDEHFELWERGYARVLHRLRELSVPVVLLDIAWAEVFDGQELPRGARARLGMRGRRMQRGYRAMSRSFIRGEALGTALVRLVSIEPTRNEEVVAEAQRENVRYRRYIETASALADTTIARDVADVRMKPDHKWGIGPYHYRDADYVGISTDIRATLPV